MGALRFAALAAVLSLALLALPASADPTWVCTDDNEEPDPTICVGANVGGPGDTGPCHAFRMHQQWFQHCYTAGDLPRVPVKVNRDGLP